MCEIFVWKIIFHINGIYIIRIPEIDALISPSMTKIVLFDYRPSGFQRRDLIIARNCKSFQLISSERMGGESVRSFLFLPHADAIWCE